MSSTRWKLLNHTHVDVLAYVVLVSILNVHDTPFIMYGSFSDVCVRECDESKIPYHIVI